MMINLKRLLNSKISNRLVCIVRRDLNARVFRKANLYNSSLARFHTFKPRFAKLYVDTENSYAFGVIESINYINVPVTPNVESTSNIIDECAFDSFMNQEWKAKSPTEIFEAFKAVAYFCSTRGIDISDERFDRLVDGFVNNVEKLTDEQLLDFLDLLGLFPACDSFKSHNFHDMWSALDDVCCWRMSKWPTEKLFLVADKWYKLNLGKVCDFIYEVLERLSVRPKRLTKNQLVHAFFYMNVCRKRKLDFEYEVAVENTIEDMSVDEAAIVALGYFKTQSKVKIPHVCSVMMRKVNEADNIHELTLCSILKIIRYSSHTSLTDQIYDFMNNILPRLEGMSVLCLLHAALLGTTLQIMHEPTLRLVAQKIAKDIGNVEEIRLKDIERILLPLSMFHFDPETKPDIYEAAFNEIHEERRRKEIVKYPRCMPSALLFLSIRNFYSPTLTNMVLDQDFIDETYGKSSRMLPRELFSLDVSTEIECPHYTGNRLSPAKRYKAAKWLSDYTPTLDQKKKISAADRVILDVISTSKQICGGEEFLYIDHILPHFSKADIIICKDKQSDKFVRPTGFRKYILGDVMRPHDTDTLDWYAVVIAGWNNTIRNTSNLVGTINMKLRQLKLIGYKPIPVVWCDYMPLTQQDKIKYIVKQLE